MKADTEKVAAFVLPGAIHLGALCFDFKSPLKKRIVILTGSQKHNSFFEASQGWDRPVP
jgi:hypothetical protein